MLKSLALKDLAIQRMVFSLLMVVVLIATTGVARAQDSALEISSISELLATPLSQAGNPRPIHVRGIVTSTGDGFSQRSFENQGPSFSLEDASGGIWVRARRAVDQGVLRVEEDISGRIEYGALVEVEGIVELGGYAPVILPSRIDVTGPASLPEPLRPNLDSFFRGAHVMRRVAIEGVVQDVTDSSDTTWLLRVETGAGYFLTRLPKLEPFAPERLLDAKIEVTGAAGVSRNWRSQLICPRILVGAARDLSVLEPAPEDPFSVPKIELAEIDNFSTGGRPLHRRRIDGVLTFYDGKTSMYMQSEDWGTKVNLLEPVDVTVGERVEVSGFIDSTEYLHGLRSASVRATGDGDPIEPEVTSPTQILADHYSVPKWDQIRMKTADGRLVTMQGKVIGIVPGTSRIPSRFELDCGDTVVTAYLSSPMQGLREGTQVDATGVVRIRYAPEDSSSMLVQPIGVDLLLRNAADVRVLTRPSWWTTQRIRVALMIALLTAMAATLWAVALNRTVRRQTKQLAVEMRSRRDAVIEFQAAIGERTRLAGNLHDTVLQTMAGVSYQLEACELANASGDGDVSGHLETAGRMIQRGQDDLRNVVWALHCLPLDEGSFPESVLQIADRLNRDGRASPRSEIGRDDRSNGSDKTRIRVVAAENFPRLADFIAGNLLLVIQEACHNAIRHARADEINVRLSATDDGALVSVRVEDDGSGFDVNNCPRSHDGHFGIEGMSQRVERLGGKFEIESVVGEGTSICLEVPLRDFDDEISIGH
ncbi:MAG: sensor histidine kinase [Planctomycetota bacterium]